MHFALLSTTAPQLNKWKCEGCTNVNSSSWKYILNFVEIYLKFLKGCVFIQHSAKPLTFGTQVGSYLLNHSEHIFPTLVLKLRTILSQCLKYIWSNIFYCQYLKNIWSNIFLCLLLLCIASREKGNLWTVPTNSDQL